MNLFDIGRVCVKTAGRDAGQKCVIIDTLDNNKVLVDGQARRKRCSIKHLEPLEKVLAIEKNTPHEEIIKVFGELGITLISKKSKKASEKPKKHKKSAKPSA